MEKLLVFRVLIYKINNRRINKKLNRGRQFKNRKQLLRILLNNSLDFFSIAQVFGKKLRVYHILNKKKVKGVIVSCKINMPVENVGTIK